MTTHTQPHDPIEGMIEKIDSVIFQEGETIEHIDLNYSTFMYLVRQSILSAKEIGKKEGMELGRVAGVREAEKIISEHNARILNEFQKQGTADMPLIAYDERVCLVPAIQIATKETKSSLTNLLSLHE